VSIKVRYFASLKELIGREQDECEYQPNMTAMSVWEKSVKTQSMPNNILAAINMEYVDLQALVIDGDEVAFFPPVTGGLQ